MSDPFVSFAQNFEDVMLWRALGREPDGTPRRRPGTWIDVGAWDPVLDNVTHAFHLRGWRGLNVEPSPEYFPRLARARPGDVNIQAAAGDAEGTLTFWAYPASGLSTGDPVTAAQHRADGLEAVAFEVPVHRIDRLAAEHELGPIDFLKVDVEGMERAVLTGADLPRLRPRIVLIEATKPNSQVQTHADWADVLAAGGYEEVYFDGLNRFYVLAEEHALLAPAFAAPPNVFDRFIRADDEPRRQAVEAGRWVAEAASAAQRGMLLAEREVSRAERRAEQALAVAERARRERDLTLSRAEQEVAAAAAHTAHLEGLLTRTYQSTSWRLSRPVRKLAGTVQRVRAGGRAGSGDALELALQDALAPPRPASEPAPILQIDEAGSPRARAALRRLRGEMP